MRLEIRRRGVKVTEELRAYLRERLRLALGRFARHIDLVRVYLRGASGSRGGPGKKCRVVVELPPRAHVVVAGADAVLSGAIARTVSRAGFAVKRHVKRRRAHRRPPRRPGRLVGRAADLARSGAGESNGRPRTRPHPGEGEAVG